MPVANENTHTHTQNRALALHTSHLSIQHIPPTPETVLRTPQASVPANYSPSKLDAPPSFFAVSLWVNQSPFGTYNVAYSRKCYKWGSGPSRHLALDLPVHVHKELDIGEDARCLVLYQKWSEEIACRSSNIHLIKRSGQGLQTTKVQWVVPQTNQMVRPFCIALASSTSISGVLFHLQLR